MNKVPQQTRIILGIFSCLIGLCFAFGVFMFVGSFLFFSLHEFAQGALLVAYSTMLIPLCTILFSLIIYRIINTVYTKYATKKRVKPLPQEFVIATLIASAAVLLYCLYLILHTTHIIPGI